MPFFDFSNKKIMVVGGDSGIGRQTVLLLDQLGASVVIVGRNNEKLMDVKACLSNSRSHLYLQYDVTDFSGCKDLFESAILDGKKLDGLVYSAGIAKAVPLRIMTADEYNSIFAVNYFGFVNMVSMYSKRKFNTGGSIVGISAVNVHVPQKCMTLYASSKAAVEAAVKTMALELADQRIRVNAVIPGAVASPMSDMIDKDTMEEIVSHQLLGMLTSEQIANFIVFLLSDKSSAITGRSIYADGGALGQY